MNNHKILCVSQNQSKMCPKTVWIIMEAMEQGEEKSFNKK